MRTAGKLLLLVSMAALVPAQAGWVVGQTPTQVGSGEYSGEYTWFSTAAPVTNPANCANNDIYVIRIQPKSALAILLTAKVSGSPVRLAVNDTTCDAATGRPLVNEVGIQ